MKFKTLMNGSSESRALFDDFRKYAWDYYGAKVIGQRDVHIIDKATGEFQQSAIAVLLKGSFISYLRHKIRKPRGVFMGWDIPMK
jgi:hypothetical protein